MSTESHPLPTQIPARIDTLDILRGFAVFGIFVVNIEIMNCVFMNEAAFSEQWTSPIDRIAVNIRHLFFYSKFFPVFSFLFGLGISMQALKSLEKRNASATFFLRRMAILFFFGLLHILLLWSGDVLHLYAILGLLCIPLLRVPNKLLIGGAVLLLIFPFYDQLAEGLFRFTGFNPERFLEGYTSEEVTRVLRNGTYLETMHFRLLEYLANIPLLFVYLAPIALAMFLLGLYIGKKKYVYALGQLVNRTKKPMIAAAIITNAYRIFFLFLLPDLELMTSASRPIFLRFMFLSDVTMALFYLWLIGWLMRFPLWQKILSPLKWVGRMALTNYILHSFIGLFLFSSLGFGRYQTLSPTQTLLIATAVFALQLAFCRLWLNHFLYGPLEWVWRCLSYRKILPLKRAAAAGAKLA